VYGQKGKRYFDIAQDAVIALTSLDHDYFITSDKCLNKSWKTVIEKNAENKKLLEKSYKIPRIIHRRTIKGIFEAIIKDNK